MKKTSLLLMILALLGLGIACDREMEREEYQEESIGTEVQEMEEGAEELGGEIEEDATEFGENVEETGEDIVE